MVRRASGRLRRSHGEPLRSCRGARRVTERRSTIEDWKPYIGRKVSVRYRLHGDAQPFSEAIGVVMQVAADEEGAQSITILSRRGETKQIHTRDLIAAKLFKI